MTFAAGPGKRTVLLASAADEVALGLPARLSRPDIVVVTPADLSQPGWYFRPGAGGSAIVAEGQVLGSEQIAAVVTRLPWVSESELPQIVPADRAYVAAEMHAFLVAWLSELACPVANRPSPNCLCGPFWRHERWVAEAARAGLVVVRARRSVDAHGAQDAQDAQGAPARLQRVISITVVGKRCFGEGDEALREHALSLARATGVETLTVHFGDAGAGLRFLTANPWPCLEDDEVASALLDHLVAPTGAGR
ncbi:MAG: hypothetical protein WKG32_04990 [Gemmatimonadaceae bacterium]